MSSYVLFVCCKHYAMPYRLCTHDVT